MEGVAELLLDVLKNCVLRNFNDQDVILNMLLVLL